MSYIISSQPNLKVAVCLYLYHTDLWVEFKNLLTPLREHIKLYLALPNKNNIIIQDLDLFDYQISYHDNYGVDVAPFLYQLPLIKEKLFIKIHSKKSLWGYKFHINWRQFILNDLIGSSEIFKSNVKQLLNNKAYTVLGNPTLLMKNREGNNSIYIETLCDILNIDYNKVKDSQFIAGNMFMGKTKFFQKVFSQNKIAIIDSFLQQDVGKINDAYNGTYSHAMERLFGYIVSYHKYQFCYPKHKIIKILNKEAPNKKYFNLIKMYNNYCYLLEDPNVYGYFDISNDTIIWYHLENTTSQKYKIINKSTIEKIV